MQQRCAGAGECCRSYRVAVVSGLLGTGTQGVIGNGGSALRRGYVGATSLASEMVLRGSPSMSSTQTQ
eukprot:15435998-Alexandrium_andersonii.AAC.1